VISDFNSWINEKSQRIILVINILNNSNLVNQKLFPMRKINLLKKILLAGLLMMYVFMSSTYAQMAKGQTKFLGNIHYQGQTSLNYDYYWNQVTPGNAGKWASCEQNRGDFNYWSWLDRAYTHAKQNGYPFKEHTLIWGGSSGDPAWVKTLTAAEQLDEVTKWMTAVATRYPDCDMVDVVNEPLHAPPTYAAALGGAGTTGWDWVIWCFTKARALFPKSKLILNEYNAEIYTTENTNLITIVNLLKARNLIDGIGLQCHSLETVPLATIQANFNKLAATGVDLYISEYEVQGDDATQLSILQTQFPYFWTNPAVKGITMWGFLDGEMWRPTAYLLGTDGKTERPALQWLRSYFNYAPTNVMYPLQTSVTGSGSITVSPAGGTYAPFTTVTTTAVPATGYVFTGWGGDKSGAVNPTTISMISSRIVTANFAVKGVVPQYTLNVTISGDGSVTANPAGSPIDSGTVVTLTANPTINSLFTGWSGAVTGTTNPIQITMNSNKALTATFQAYNGSACASPTAITLPFVKTGVAENCYFTSGNISNVNSWNMDMVTINGVVYTNIWSSTMPARVNGGYNIYYKASSTSAHLEVNGTNGTIIPVTGVTVTPTTAPVNVGSTSQLTASVVPSTATNTSVTWSSSNTAIATVSATGLVTGVAAGTATITVTTQDGSKTATCIVTVSGTVISVTGITISPATAPVNVGATTQLTATVAPINATNKTVTWSSSNTAIASVSATGLVTGVAAGTATITVTTQDGAKTATCAVTVNTVTIPPCSFGTPLATGLPSLNKSYNYVYVLGTGGPSLSNVSNFTINWDLSNKGLWQLSMNTRDGKPNWYVDIKVGATQTLASVQPSITLSGTGFTGLDGSYYAAIDNGNFVLVSKTGGFTLYFSSSATAPVCAKSASSLTEDNGIKLYPNPFTGSISLQIANPDAVQSIDVVDELGRVLLVMGKSSINNEMKIGESLNAGIYFVRVKTSNGVKSFMINKK
jgi:endo-1,4-beta-xylanase